MQKPDEVEILNARECPHPEERRLRRVSKDGTLFSLMVRDGARAPPHHEGFLGPRLTKGSPQALVLTKSAVGTMFPPLRGHLSRPACSHVKQLAKQAGDRSDPGRTYVQAGFFYGLSSGGFLEDRPKRSVSNGKRAIDTKSGDPCRRTLARGGSSELAAGGVRRGPAAAARLRHRSDTVSDRL